MGVELKKLKEVPIFADASKETLSALSKLLEEKQYPEGTHVVREGELADAMYILRSGELEVRKVIKRDPEKYKTLAILEESDFFGEMAVFSKDIRAADVITRKESVLWKLDYSDLFQMMDRDPASGVKTMQVIIKILVSRIETLNSELATLYELGRLLPAMDDVDRVAESVFELSMNAVNSAKHGFLTVLNVYNEEFDVYQSAGTFKEKHLQFSDPVCAWMLENKSPLIVKDTASDPRFKDKAYAGRSFIASPFIHDGNLLGFILFNHPSKKNAFNYKSMVLMSTVCMQLAAKFNDIERNKEEALKQRLSNGKLTVDLG